jgi:purine-nucleoside phosphorylase
MNLSTLLPPHPRDPAVFADVSVGIVLGSGISVLHDLEDRIDIPYAEVVGLPEVTVAGHQGTLTIGTIPGGRRVAIARGRFHLYEGHGLDAATSLIRMFHGLGLRHIILTNAAGGLVGPWIPGDLMIIRDQVNLLGGFRDASTFEPRGASPYQATWGDRLLAWAGENLDFSIREGVYAGLLGPNYETPAEILWLQRIGTHAVGMSTVPEAEMARSLGLSLLGISCITNIAVTAEAQAETSHGDVVDVAQKASRRMDLVLRGACQLFE